MNCFSDILSAALIVAWLLWLVVLRERGVGMAINIDSRDWQDFLHSQKRIGVALERIATALETQASDEAAAGAVAADLNEAAAKLTGAIPPATAG